MKIAMVVSRFPVLSETFILNQITGLLRLGHEVDIYALDGREPLHAGAHPAVERYGLLERTFFLEPTRTPVSNWWRVGRPLSSLFPRKAITDAPLLEKTEYDIVHCQFGVMGWRTLPIRELGSLKGALVVSFRGYDISGFLRDRGERIYDELFKKADFLLANCDYFKKRLVSLGCDAAKIQIHYSGIDLERFRFAPRFFQTNRTIQLLSVGRLIEKKGFEYAVRAVARLVKTDRLKVIYKIIGEGPLRGDLEKMIEKLGLTGTVFLAGAMTQSGIIAAMENADLFLAPSVRAVGGDEDGPVNSIKEAMASGVPVIATRHGGIPELVEDDVSGFLVPERDPEVLSQKIIYLLNHPRVGMTMSAAGRACVERKFDIEKLNNELVSVYQKVIRSSRFNQKEEVCRTSR